MLNWSAASWSRSRVVGEDGVLTLKGEGASSPLSATTTRDSTERGPFCREGEWGPVEVGVGVEISTTRGANERRGERFNDGVDACTRFRLESHSTSCFMAVVVAGVFVGEGEILGVEPHRKARVAVGVDFPIDVFSPHRSEIAGALLQGNGISLRVAHMTGDESFVTGACSESWVVGIEGTAVFVRCENAENCRSRE